MSENEWEYLRLTIDVAVYVGESSGRKDFVRRLLHEEARPLEVKDAISDGWMEVDGYEKVEDHGS